MRVSTKVRYFDDLDEDLETQKIKWVNFRTEDVKTFEESEVFDDHTTIFFNDGYSIDACIPFKDFHTFIMPPDAVWPLKKIES